MMRCDAILFDKDGTLFQFRATWEAWADSFLRRISGEDTDQAAALGRAIGFDLGSGHFDADSVVIAGTPAEVTEALMARLPGRGFQEILDILNEEAELAPQVEAVPLAPLLDALRRSGLRLGVATNDAEAPALAHLEGAGVRDRFDFIAGFDSGHGAKPGPGQMLAFAQAMGIAPGRIAMVGDSTHDLHAGRSAGMQTVAVLTGLAVDTELAPLADVVLPDIGHLPAWLAET